jgi:hypothetical protein
MTTPSHLVVYDAHAEEGPVRYLLTSLQGVVNRTEPRVYLLISPDGPGVDPVEHEDFWLAEIVAHFGVTTETVADPWALVERFAGEVAGAVVYDPAQPNTINVATMIAAQEDAVIIDPSLIDAVTARGIPVIGDLRGRFASSVEMYAWAWEELWPDCTHAILAYLHPDRATLRDYLIAQKVFVIGLDPHRADELALLENFYAESPMNISVLGWVVDELLGVKLVSQYGKFHNASDGVPNLSVHAGLTPIVPGPPAGPEAPPLENAIYVAFAYTDGDNATYIHRHMLDRWLDPARGTIPIGWELNATLLDLSPATYRYYVATATENDAIIGPVSGVGYMYPRVYPDLAEFLRLTRLSFERHGYRSIWVINDNLTFSDELAVAYGGALDVDGIYVDYWPNGDRPWHVASDGTPIVRDRYVYLAGPEQIPAILDDAAIEKLYHYPDGPTFVFIGVNAWITPPTMLAGIVDTLDARYRVVRPDVMLRLIGKALGE